MYLPNSFGNRSGRLVADKHVTSEFVTVRMFRDESQEALVPRMKCAERNVLERVKVVMTWHFFPLEISRSFYEKYALLCIHLLWTNIRPEIVSMRHLLDIRSLENKVRPWFWNKALTPDLCHFNDVFSSFVISQIIQNLAIFFSKCLLKEVPIFTAKINCIGVLQILNVLNFC